MALFDRNRFCALVSAFMLSAVLAGCGSSGGGAPAPNPTFTSGTHNQAQITDLLNAGEGRDVVDIAGDTVSDIDSDMAGVQPGLVFEGFLDGLGGDAHQRARRFPRCGVRRVGSSAGCGAGDFSF